MRLPRNLRSFPILSATNPVIAAAVLGLFGCAGGNPVPAVPGGVPQPSVLQPLSMFNGPTIPLELPPGCNRVQVTQTVGSSGALEATRRVVCTLAVADPMSANWKELASALLTQAGQSLGALEAEGSEGEIQIQMTASESRTIQQGVLKVESRQALKSDLSSQLTLESESRKIEGEGAVQQIREADESVSAELRSSLVLGTRIRMVVQTRYLIAPEANSTAARPSGPQQDLVQAQFNEAVKRYTTLFSEKLSVPQP